MKIEINGKPYIPPTNPSLQDALDKLSDALAAMQTAVQAVKQAASK